MTPPDRGFVVGIGVVILICIGIPLLAIIDAVFNNGKFCRSVPSIYSNQTAIRQLEKKVQHLEILLEEKNGPPIK